MRYLDVCAGISAATLAWKGFGWETAAFSEIDAVPRQILSYHYPEVALHGDFTTIEGDQFGTIDLLMGGTPCQDFSVGGLRAGLAGKRGNLSLEYLRLASRTRARWIVWENVPGVLSSDNRRALGAFLGGLGKLGYGFAYRILDAQYFGIPQQRRRVFVVGYLGDWRRAAAVLFERSTLSIGGGAWAEKGTENLGTISTRFAEGSLDLFDQINAMAKIGAPIRRLTPLETERAMGVPDGFTMADPSNPISDKKRYKVLGNSIPVPPLAWIGQRINTIEGMTL